MMMAMSRLPGRSRAALTLVLATLATAVAAAPAGAAPEPVRLRGTIASLAAGSLMLRTTGGDTVAVKLPGTARVLRVVEASLGDIQAGSYIGTATKSVGTTLVALEVVVFPPAMKGAGEGHYAWDRLPDTTRDGAGGMAATTMTNGSVAAVAGRSDAVETTMTNGSVAAAVSGGGARRLTVTYAGGEQTILVPPTAPIVTFLPGTSADLTAGASVFVRATRDAGVLTANAVAVGADGLKPPM